MPDRHWDGEFNDPPPPRKVPPRRRLFEGGSGMGQPITPHKSHDLLSESFSVTEQAASLSSRAMLEQLSSDGILEEEAEEEAEEEPVTVAPSPEVADHPSNSRYFDDDSFADLIPSEPPLPQISEVQISSDPQTHGILATLARYTPSVLVGLLLNILDGLSYGMILFPLGTAMFDGLESVGLSLFYISTIISQLVFSLGGSSFKSCIGSEMIEIVPFFHALATSIATKLEGCPREEVLATTVTAFAVSCLVTGLTFFLLGFLRLGALVGFFPLHILLGCIGGVGGFLVLTGIEVASRVHGGVQFTYDSLSYILRPEVLIKWGACLLMGCVLMFAERRLHHPLVVPGILVSTFVGFYVVIALVPNLTLQMARDAGWVFPAQEAGEPWYFVYTLYRPSLIHIRPIVECVPVMFALTFFGLIHVPINIPALAAAVKNDSVNVNQELVAHGISNTLSALCGSIQNYLVYTNSVMFIKSGADKPVAGVMLAFATAGVMVAGPGIIGYIPVIVVASLIFMMGFDLITEALVDTYGSVRKQDYATMLVIALIMGLYDFVVGIIVGITLACLFFVISSARQSPVLAKMTGEHAHSTVIRHPVLQNFLRDMGKQVYTIRLTGALFFGTNGTLEREVRQICDGHARPGALQQIRYLIIDLQNVTDIDYCTVDTFLKLKRLLDAARIRLVLAGAESAGHKIRGLKAVDLVPETVDPSDVLGVRVFATLNIALSWCENQFIKSYYAHSAGLSKRLALHTENRPSAPAQVPQVPQSPHQWELTLVADSPNTRFSSSGVPSGVSSTTNLGTTPRSSHFHLAAHLAAKEDLKSVHRWRQHRQPVPLIMQVLATHSKRRVDFWSRLADYFDEGHVNAGEVLPPGFHLIESGIFVITHDSGYYETTLAGTAYGELTRETRRPATVRAEVRSKVWSLSLDGFERCRAADPDLAVELLAAYLALVGERYIRLTDYYWIRD